MLYLYKLNLSERGDVHMQNIIRLTKTEVKNLKNVKSGILKMNSSFKTIESSDVIGLYGQNGSGKTALVEGYNLLKNLICGEKGILPAVNEHLIYYNEKAIELNFDFNVKNEFGEYFLKYYVTLIPGSEHLIVAKEELRYRENERGKRFKTIVKKEDENIVIRNKNVQQYDEELRISVMVANKMAAKSASSFIFREELIEIYQSSLNNLEFELMRNIVVDFNHDFHVIDVTNYGYLVANIMMPFSVHLENVRGEIPYNMKDSMLLPIHMFHDIEEVINRANIVLQHIIPGLQIKVNKISEQKMEDGEDGIRFEFLSKKGHIELPLRSESEGTLKIISILSTLIAVYNNPNAFVVIDELDASVFEYLLGEILEILDGNGKGQLFFTSHNLRILEVLPTVNLRFTTANEKNRFIQLKGIKKDSNARDIYLRAVQLGGQDEAIYAQTDAYDIKMSFRKAGI